MVPGSKGYACVKKHDFGIRQNMGKQLFFQKNVRIADNVRNFEVRSAENPKVSWGKGFCPNIIICSEAAQRLLCSFFFCQISFVALILLYTGLSYFFVFLCGVGIL